VLEGSIVEELGSIISCVVEVLAGGESGGSEVGGTEDCCEADPRFDGVSTGDERSMEISVDATFETEGAKVSWDEDSVAVLIPRADEVADPPFDVRAVKVRLAGDTPREEEGPDSVMGTEP